MKIYKYAFLLAALSLGTVACKKQLDVGNPNNPTLAANVTTEAGLISLAQGGVYINGFSNGDGWLGDSYFSLPLGYHELMADNVGADASNNQVTTMGIPDYIISNGIKVTNSAPQIGIIRAYNNRASTGADNNAIYYQWLNMYALNNACNLALSRIDVITYKGDAAETKKNTFKAWCYWWKGYAYASIGSMYYSGVIVDEPNMTNNEYISHDKIIAESNKNFKLAEEALAKVSSPTDYADILGKLIPEFCQVGLGQVPTVDMWKHSINTMMARNILVNKLAPFVNSNPAAVITKSSTSTMAATDWNDVLTYAGKGIVKGDFIFTGRTTGSNNFFSPAGGSVAALTSGLAVSSTFKISERFIQYFKTGDKRFANNFDSTGVKYNNDYIYSTRWSMLDGGNGIANVYTYSNESQGEYELIIAGSYEENALMLAEAYIRTGSIEKGLGLIDDVRNYLGAGVPAVAGTGLTLTTALKELVAERKVALIFKGLSYYDSRRWGWIYDIANGGGSYNNIVVRSRVVIPGVTINYNFLDYWDVPADESVLNPPSATSEKIMNPNF